MNLWSDRQSRAAGLSVASNLIFFILKLMAGLLTGSIAVLSDALDSGEDLIASGVALFSVRLALRPADLEHPYGHGKVESLGTVFEAAVIAVGAAFVTYYALSNITDDDRDIETTFGLIVMGAAFVANLFVGRYVGKVARETDSMILLADARHIMTNMAQAAAVATALALVAITDNAIFDPVVALLLAAFLFYTASQLLRQAIDEIMDVSLPDDEIEVIARAVRDAGPDVKGFHRLRARRSGPMRLVDLHLIMAADASVAEAHEVTEEIERRVKARYPRSSLVIHTEPDDGRFRGPPEHPTGETRSGRAGFIAEPLPEAAEEQHGHHH